MMKPAQVAEELNISTETLRMYAEEGRVPFVSTPGGHRRYILEDVKHALAMEKAARLRPLTDAEEETRISAGGKSVIKRAPRWRSARLTQILDDAEAGVRTEGLSIPYIGLPGTSRFVVGQGARA
jgi:excisionase family DNA binding protein